MRQMKWMRWPGRIDRLVVAMMTCVALASSAHAVDKTWLGSANGNFNTAGNWSPSGVPGTFDTAIINVGAVAPPYNVLFLSGFNPINAVVDKLRIDSSPINFTPSLSTLTIDSTNITETGRSLVIGRLGSGTPNARLDNLLSQLNTVYATLGVDAGSSGTLNINGGIFQVTGTNAVYDLIVGLNGTGAINMSGGTATLVAGDMVLGKNTGSSGAIGISGAATNWISSGWMYVGGAGDGALNINGGGTMIADFAYVAGSTGSSGTVMVEGSGSTWTSSDFIAVGNAGDGILNIFNSGRVQDVTGYVGAGAGSTGIVTVLGSASRWINTGNLFIGHDGEGTLNIGGGRVDDVNAEIGFHAGSIGTVSVAAPTGLLRSTGQMCVGREGEGTLAISANGKVENAAAFIGFESNGSGEVTIDGNASDWLSNGNLIVGRAGHGELHILNGASARNPFLGTSASIGDMPGSTGEVSIDGSGSELFTAATVVGREGAGSLTATSNCEISASDLTVGRGAAANGNMQINGSHVLTNTVNAGTLPGSVASITFENYGLWDHTSFAPAEPFIIGDAGTATLNILSNSDVLLFQQTLPVVGNQPTGHGTINIDGQGSELFVNIQEVSIGREGAGVLNINNAGLFHALNSPVYLGELPSGDGHATVSGTNSLLRAASVFVGNAGTGSLDILNGGHVEAAEISFALFIDASGTANISGAGSRMSVLTGNGLLIVGSADDASLTIAAGGVAEATEVFIGDGSTAHGTVSVDGATSQLSGVEEINVGYFGTGTLTLTNAGKAVAPLIDINPGSIVRGNGTLQGDVSNFGTVAPGLSVGTINIGGDYTQASLPAPPGTLAIELASPSSYDRLIVTGTATLGGTLQVSLINGYVPAVGQTFTILTAAEVDNTFTLSAPAGISVSYTPTSVILNVTGTVCPADVNNSGAVDADDLVAVILAWGACPGGPPPAPCPADINHSGTVDADDLVAVILGWGACP